MASRPSTISRSYGANKGAKALILKTGNRKQETARTKNGGRRPGMTRGGTCRSSMFVMLRLMSLTGLLGSLKNPAFVRTGLWFRFRCLLSGLRHGLRVFSCPAKETGSIQDIINWRLIWFLIMEKWWRQDLRRFIRWRQSSIHSRLTQRRKGRQDKIHKL